MALKTFWEEKEPVKDLEGLAPGAESKPRDCFGHVKGVKERDQYEILLEVKRDKNREVTTGSYQWRTLVTLTKPLVFSEGKVFKRE